MDEIRVIETVAQDTAGLRAVIRFEDLGPYVGTVFDRVAELLVHAGVTPTGPPVARYRVLGSSLEVEAGFPVPSDTGEVPGLRRGRLPAARVVEVVHVGRYEALRETYARVEAWAGEHEVTLGDESWELYEAGPSSDPDPATWRTRVVHPVAVPRIGASTSRT